MSCGYSTDVIQQAMAEQAKRNQAESVEGEEKLAEMRNKLRVLEQPSSAQEQRSWTSIYETSQMIEKAENIKNEIKSLEEKNKLKDSHDHAHGGCSHDHRAEIEIYDQSFSVKIDKCKKFMTYGKLFYREHQYQRSLSWFEKVFVWLSYTFPNLDDVDEALQFFTVQITALYWKVKIQHALKKYKICISSWKMLKQEVLNFEGLDHVTSASVTDRLEYKKFIALELEAAVHAAGCYRCLHHFEKSKDILSTIMELVDQDFHEQFEPIVKMHQREAIILQAQERKYKVNARKQAKKMLGENN
eukprot:snap_masked-scaffold_34-processed-gene-3.53-mRNA-1 protein AED:1.00 eAED:1.00 QI:0/-1/0/0/-1/1/1/0/300